MSLRAPLWLQLVLVWIGALALSTLLLGVAGRRPYRFFWLLPWPPSPRLIWASVVGFFRAEPLLASALVGVPLLALLLSLALLLGHVMLRVRAGGAAAA